MLHRVPVIATRPARPVLLAARNALDGSPPSTAPSPSTTSTTTSRNGQDVTNSFTCAIARRDNVGAHHQKRLGVSSYLSTPVTTELQRAPGGAIIAGGNVPSDSDAALSSLIYRGGKIDRPSEVVLLVCPELASTLGQSGAPHTASGAAPPDAAQMRSIASFAVIQSLEYRSRGIDELTLPIARRSRWHPCRASRPNTDRLGPGDS